MKIKEFIKKHKVLVGIVLAIITFIVVRKVQLYLELQRNLARTELVIMGDTKQEALDALEDLKQFMIKYEERNSHE